MVDIKSIKDYFRRQNAVKVEIDPTAELSFVPSLDKEFLYLLGLEKVVQFRSELLDKFENSVPKKQKGKGKKKSNKSTTSAVEPYTPPKDPLICAKCSTDFSCSWERDINGSLLCQLCLKCSWRKEHWLTARPEESEISPASGILKSHISASSTQPVRNNSEVHQEEAAVTFPSASSDGQQSDQKVPKMWDFHPVSPDNTSSSPLSPVFYPDSSSSLPSPSSTDPLSPHIYCPSPFYESPLYYGSSSPYYSSSSELNFSSSSLSLSPPHSSQCPRKKTGTPYWMDTPLAKSLLKDGKVKQETIEDENRCSTWNSPLQSKEKTDITPSSMGLNQHNLQKTQVCNTGSVVTASTGSTLFPSANKQEAEIETPKPSLKKTTKKHPTIQTMHEESKPNQGKLCYNPQETQVCNTCSDIMATTTSTPVTDASKQKIETETLKPSLKKTTKKMDQSKLQKASSTFSHGIHVSRDHSSSTSTFSHSTKFKDGSFISPKETPIKSTFGNFLSTSPTSSNQPIKEDLHCKQKVAFPSISPSQLLSSTPGSSLASSHSAKSSQYLPKFPTHHVPATQAATSKSFQDSVKECQQALWSRPRCGSECKPDPLVRSLSTNPSSTQQGKTSKQAAVPQKSKVFLKNTTIKKWIQGPE